ncbi:unnamed protein product (macronuclear) [Paramecium tetraurelia]|uniref:Protein kinase domain-containing protein n=1 Tax=Paramecium tetraurelia TaxID=5888 RepID=A0BQQ8_PARTE|nr:uncharacterized protein GSPATT00031104001 [Paramecium tetraurelia]CAK60875.1 unnamed protein product [Paramecium tetraurelia]|eukprot:XP_001428273.1 hypothetical protein (macronuclear) [Paramecium tetraurelia strain d4-2]
MNVQVGKFQFNSRFCLGEGAYGKVFLGQDTENNEQVAIKQIDTKFIEQQDKYIKQQIINEIEILKKCNHPNIVRFIDLIDTPKYIYIIIEYCKDGDLKELLNQKRLSEVESFDVLRQIVEGFKELQKHSIIHRDLKPANILINNGIFKIADFGFAKIVNNYSSTNMLKSLVGSPYYMAPQLLGYQQYCFKCDIWSLAVIYFEMVFGNLPWLASDPQSLLKKILSQPIIEKLKQAKISQFSMYFLEKTLTIDEFRRPNWQEVVQMITTSPLMKADKNSIPQPQSQSKTNILEVSASCDTKSNINSIQPEQQKKRQEIIFKHYLCQEILVNKSEILQFCDGNNVLLKLAFCLSKWVLILSQQLLKELPELKREHEFYVQFMHDIEELRLSCEFSIERVPQICQDYCIEYLTIAQKNLQNISETYLLVLTEYLINFARVLRDGKDSPIDYEELAQSKLNDYDFELYHNILETNLSAIVI